MASVTAVLKDYDAKPSSHAYLFGLGQGGAAIGNLLRFLVGLPANLFTSRRMSIALGFQTTFGTQPPQKLLRRQVLPQQGPLPADVGKVSGRQVRHCLLYTSDAADE